MTIIETILAWLICVGLVVVWLFAQFARGMTTTGDADLGKGPNICLVIGLIGLGLLWWSALR
jgi:hypothetical protein